MDKHRRIQQLLIAGSILSISFITASGYAIAPALPVIAKKFPDIPVSVVDMLGTVQQIVVIFAVFASVMIAKRIGMKNTIMLGVVLLGISSVPPMFSNRFEVLMISRLLLGLGIGLFNSLAIGIINLYYSSNEKLRLNLLGSRAAVESFGHCGLNFAAGLLLLISWHAAFWLYLIAVPILLMFWKYVPDIRYSPKQIQHHKSQLSVYQRLKMARSTVFLTILLFIIVLCNTAISIEVPNMVEVMHLGSGTYASIIVSMNTLAAGIIAFFFGEIVHLIHRFTLPLGLAFIACGCLVMSMSHNSITLMTGSVLCGLAYPVSGTYIYALIGKLVPKNLESLAISVTLIGCNFGAFICPIVVSLLGHLGHLFRPGDSMRLAFLMLFIIAIITTVIVLGMAIYHHSEMEVKRANYRHRIRER